MLEKTNEIHSSARTQNLWKLIGLNLEFEFRKVGKQVVWEFKGLHFLIYRLFARVIQLHECLLSSSIQKLSKAIPL